MDIDTPPGIELGAALTAIGAIIVAVDLALPHFRGVSDRGGGIARLLRVIPRLPLSFWGALIVSAGGSATLYSTVGLAQDDAEQPLRWIFVLADETAGSALVGIAVSLILTAIVCHIFGLPARSDHPHADSGGADADSGR